MKFLVDMVLSPRTVDFMKANGYNAVRVNEVFEGRGIDDKRIFSLVRRIKQQRTIAKQILSIEKAQAHIKTFPNGDCSIQITGLENREGVEHSFNLFLEL